jgi:hypothetical protein
MDKLAALLRKAYPDFTIIAGDLFYWSPQTKEVFYKEAGDSGSLLHELGHALLGHSHFTTDVDLMHKEIAAWEKARELASIHGVELNQTAIERCLDSYRDWLHKRSTCPDCGSHGLQTTQRLYKCLNCHKTWKVSSSATCRPYRQQKWLQNAK